MNGLKKMNIEQCAITFIVIAVIVFIICLVVFKLFDVYRNSSSSELCGCQKFNATFLKAYSDGYGGSQNHCWCEKEGTPFEAPGW